MVGTNEAIASAYEVSTKKVEQLKKRFVEEGFAAALYRKPVTNAHRRKITGDEEAHLIALYCRHAPEGHERWTLRLLAEKMVELDIIASVSHETIRRTLKKTRVAKSAGVSSSQASQDTLLDHGGSADAGSVADGESPVPAAALARH